MGMCQKCKLMVLRRIAHRVVGTRRILDDLWHNVWGWSRVVCPGEGAPSAFVKNGQVHLDLLTCILKRTLTTPKHDHMPGPHGPGHEQLSMSPRLTPQSALR